MGAITHNGEVLQRLPADASQINFDKTGTNLNSTQTENAIKEVNTKVNTNTDDITQLKSGLTNKANVPSSSDSSLGTVTAGDSNNFTATDDGYIAIYCSSGSSQKTFSAVIRDTSILRYGTYVTATLPAYNSEAIGGLFVKKGRTYSVRNVGEYDINVYFCS